MQTRTYLLLERGLKPATTLLFFHQISVRFGSPVPEELPDLAHFLDLVEIQIADDEFLFVTRSFGNDLSPGLAVELLPESGRAMRDVVLSIFAEVPAV